MFQRNLVFRQNIQHVAAEADLAVHQVLVDIDRSEVLLAGDTGNGIRRQFLISTVRNDHCARFFRSVGVADIDRNACGTYRKDRCFMQYRCTHIGQLPQFGIGDRANHCRIVHNAGVCHQETGNVCPVLVQRSLYRTGYDRTGHVAAAAGERLDIAVCSAAIEARNYSMFQCAKAFPQNGFSLFIVQAAVRLEKDHFSSIYKGEAQICSNDFPVQVFAAACGIVLAGTLLEVCCDFLELIVQRKGHAQTGDNIVIPFPNCLQGIGEIQSLFCQIIAGVQHIGHLDVLGEPLAGGRRYHIPPLRICLDDCCCLLNLLCVRQTAAAELYYFRCHMFHSERKPEDLLSTPYLHLFAVNLKNRRIALHSPYTLPYTVSLY